MSFRRFSISQSDPGKFFVEGQRPHSTSEQRRSEDNELQFIEYNDADDDDDDDAFIEEPLEIPQVCLHSCIYQITR